MSVREPGLTVRSDGSVVETDHVWRRDLSYHVEARADEASEDGEDGEGGDDSDPMVRKFVWTAGASVLRRPWGDDPYYEELDMSEGAVRLNRLDNGAPLLLAHNRFDVDAVVGVCVEGTAVIEGERGSVDVRLSDAPGDANTVQKIQSRILRNGSVGYKIHKVEVTEATEDNPIKTVRVVDWEPFEVSVLPVGADDSAGFRSDEAGASGAHDNIGGQTAQREEEMPNEKPVELTAADVERAETEATASATTAERARYTEITRMCEQYSIPAEEQRKLVANGLPLHGAKSVSSSILEHLAKDGDDAGIAASVRVEAGDCEHEKRGETIRDYMLHRGDPTKFKLTEGGALWRGYSMLEVGRADLEARGISTRGMGKMALATAILEPRAPQAYRGLGGLHATADFPLLTQNATNKFLRKAYADAPKSYRDFCSRTDLPDFKLSDLTNLGYAPDLQPKNEAGEFKRGTMFEGREQWRLHTAGIIIGLTRELLINDDMRGFAKLPRAFANSAIRYENDTVWSILTGNPLMADGIALFNAAHFNMIAAGAGVTAANATVACLNAQRLLLRRALGVGGQGGVLRLNGKWLLVADQQFTLWEQFLGDGYLPITVATAMPTASMKTLRDTMISDPLLDANSLVEWFLLCDPAEFDTIVYGYLSGEGEGPQLESKIGWNTDGVEYRARETFGAKAADWRGITRNGGV